MNPKAPFYPTIEDTGTDYQGITIRDYIAIEAMKSLLQNDVNRARFELVDFDNEWVSRMAYKYADALIAESTKRSPTLITPNK